MYLCIKVVNFFVRKYKIEKIFVRRYYKCMTKQNKNSVRDYSNAVLVRSEADSNRCRRFCRPLVKPLAHQTMSRIGVQRYVIILQYPNIFAKKVRE